MALKLNFREKNQHVFKMFAVVKGFKIKIKLIKTKLLKVEMSHFSTWAQYIPQNKYGMLGKNMQIK